MSSSPSRRRLLVVGHEASRTGSPLVLLGILRWLRTQVDWDIDIAFSRGGVLVDEFRTIDPDLRVLDLDVFGHGSMLAPASFAVFTCRGSPIRRPAC